MEANKTIDVWVAVTPDGLVVPATARTEKYIAEIATQRFLFDAGEKVDGWTIRPATLTLKGEQPC